MNAIVADVFSLYLKTKNFHWHLSGPHFRDYHLLARDGITGALETRAVRALARKHEAGVRSAAVKPLALRGVIDVKDYPLVDRCTRAIGAGAIDLHHQLLDGGEPACSRALPRAPAARGRARTLGWHESLYTTN